MNQQIREYFQGERAPQRIVRCTAIVAAVVCVVLFLLSFISQSPVRRSNADHARLTLFSFWIVLSAILVTLSLIAGYAQLAVREEHHQFELENVHPSVAAIQFKLADLMLLFIVILDVLMVGSHSMITWRSLGDILFCAIPIVLIFASYSQIFTFSDNVVAQRIFWAASLAGSLAMASVAPRYFELAFFGKYLVLGRILIARCSLIGLAVACFSLIKILANVLI